MKKLLGPVTLMVAASALGGCQSPFLQSLGLVKKTPAQAGFVRGADSVVALEEGRAFLRDGQISAAVASFKIAQIDPDTAADAKNGLGVAFAKLGRLDLADRYFREALALRPSDDRFAANLLRLQRDVMLARGVAMEPAPALAAAAPAALVAAAAELPPVSAVPVKVAKRERRAEYRIVTGAGSAPAPAIEVAAREVKKPAPDAAASASKDQVTDKPAQPKQLTRREAKPLEVAF
ncbi:tetratricopeptide repeat protein [Parerythrobacter aurantius]|uniref:tetratricopeptide repeat protein n=1 Tax=Parerythrobacter aurantius TaxID=3127706 RepID=UPI00324A5201